MTSPVADVENYISYTSADEIKKICQPLFDHLNIHFFQYVKHYYTGGRLLLSSNKDWVKDYFNFEHYLYEYVNFGHAYKEHTLGYNIWTGCSQNHKGCRLWNHTKEHYKVEYLLAIYTRHDNYCELFHFGGEEKRIHLPSVFFSNLDLFHRFCLYFFDKARHIIDEANQQLFKPPKIMSFEETNRWILGMITQEKKDFEKEIILDKFYLSGQLEGQYLTHRQMQCLKGVVDGKSYKDIANELNISNRTVDYHLSEVRQIFGVNTKRQLIEALYAHDVMPYFNHI